MSTYATTRAVEVEAGTPRILIDNVDVTWLRDYATPAPRWLLTEPLAYGSSDVQLPQVHATLEAVNFGTGDLSFVRAGASVKYQRVMPDDSIVTDYRGVVVAIEVFGRILNLNIGGQFAGRAALLDEQPGLFRALHDLGRRVFTATQRVNLHMEPYPGPVTGINFPKMGGGMTLLAWTQELCAMSQTSAGVQRALMPTTWGGNTWGFDLKDSTTKHLTIYTDDARAVASLTDDSSEKPNVWYGNGIAPDGERWFNSKHPGLIQGTAPDYPMAGGVNFGLGTTDAATINGDGIRVLRDRLLGAGYLESPHEYAGAYDQAMYDAVEELKDDAGLSDNGVMTTAAWDALWDLNVTGYTFIESRIFPLYEDPRVRKFNYSATGSQIGRNPLYDPTVLRVERTIDFGPGITKQRARKWCRGQAARLAGKSWAGTLRLNGIGAISGEHNPGDPAITSADVLPFRGVRPGMNAWLPLFDGGTLVHIAGVDVDADGATLTVDTHSRDLLELAQIKARNRESRRDLRREWMINNRGAKPSGNMVPHDEWFGKINNRVECAGDDWTVVPVVMGQHGQVNRTHIRTSSALATFAFGVFSRPVTEQQLKNRIGNPLAELGEDDVPWYENADVLGDWFDDRTLLYAAGDFDQPCGYSPRRRLNARGNETGAPITGEWRDDSPWAYICGPYERAVVYFAFYGDRATALLRGRAFYAQEDDVV